MVYGIYSGTNQTKFKDDLQSLISQKLRGFAVFPINITPSLKQRIRDLQEEYLELRQSKKFTKEKGIIMMNEIDSINEDIKKLPKPDTDEDDEFRKHKVSKSKSKRKVSKRKK